MTEPNGSTADGHRLAREAIEPKIRAEVEEKFKTRLQAATWLKRRILQKRIEAEIDLRCDKQAPPDVSQLDKLRPLLPGKDDFAEFWRNSHKRNYLLPSYMAVLVFIVIAARNVEPDAEWAGPILGSLIALLVLYPMAFIVCVRRRYRRFIGCWNCGFAIGSDLIGKDLTRELGPFKWHKIVETERCPRCKARLIEPEDPT